RKIRDLGVDIDGRLRLGRDRLLLHAIRMIAPPGRLRGLGLALLLLVKVADRLLALVLALRFLGALYRENREQHEQACAYRGQRNLGVPHKSLQWGGLYAESPLRKMNPRPRLLESNPHTGIAVPQCNEPCGYLISLGSRLWQLCCC